MQSREEVRGAEQGEGEVSVCVCGVLELFSYLFLPRIWAVLWQGPSPERKSGRGTKPTLACTMSVTDIFPSSPMR